MDILIVSMSFVFVEKNILYKIFSMIVVYKEDCDIITIIKDEKKALSYFFFWYSTQNSLKTARSHHKAYL